MVPDFGGILLGLFLLRHTVELIRETGLAAMGFHETDLVNTCGQELR